MYFHVVGLPFVNHLPSIVHFQSNTYQGILITDGTHSFAVFIYQCGLLEWSGSDPATVGYYGDGNFYENHALANTANANTVACLNSPDSVWSNLIYRLNYLGKTTPCAP